MQGTLYKNIDPDTPEWFLDQMIQVGELTLLVGAPKLGKDIFGASLVGRLTTGRALPDGRPAGPVGSAIMVTPEDQSNLTTRPRLDAAGADVGQVLDLTTVKRGSMSDAFSIADDCATLRNEIEAMPDCQFVWLSPFNAVAGISLRSADNTIRRKIIGPLQTVARETGTAIVLAHHFTGDGKTIAGGQAIVDAARSILVLERDPNNPEIRVLRIERSTCSRGANPIRYVIEGTEPYSCARFLEDSGADSPGVEEPMEPGQRPRPGTGSARVLAALEGETEPRTSQWLHQKTGISHFNVKVYLGRLIKAGWVAREGRNLYSAKVTVTAPDQGEPDDVTVTPSGTYRWRAN